MKLKALTLGLAIGFAVAIAPSCGGTSGKCGPANCAGCCDTNGTCLTDPTASKDSTCGRAGNACVDCSATHATCAAATHTCTGGTGGGTGGGATGGGTGGGATGGGTGGGAASDTMVCSSEVVDDFAAGVGVATQAMAIAIAPNGDLYVAGVAWSTPSHALVRRSVDQGKTWTTVDDYVQGSGTTLPTQLAIDRDGSVFVGIEGTTAAEVRRKLAGESHFSTVTVHPAPGTSIAGMVATPEGRIVATDRAPNSNGLWESSDAGAGWSRRSGTSTLNYAYASAAAPNGDVLVVGSPGATSYSWQAALMPADGGAWSTVDSFSGTVGGFAAAIARAVTVSASGAVYVAGDDTPKWVVRRSLGAGQAWGEVDRYVDPSGFRGLPAAAVGIPQGVLVGGRTCDLGSCTQLRWVVRGSLDGTSWQTVDYGGPVPGANGGVTGLAATGGGLVFAAGYYSAGSGNRWVVKAMHCGSSAPCQPASTVTVSTGNVAGGGAVAAAGFHGNPGVDLTGDGRPDLAGVDYTSGGIYLLVNQGDGGYVSSLAKTGAANPRMVRTADLNLDGRRDLVVFATDAVQVYFGLANGGWSAATVLSGGQGVDVQGGVVVTDMNLDGIPDIVMYDSKATVRSGSTLVWLGLGNGTFAGTCQTLPSHWAANSSALGDFNGDGLPDLVLPFQDPYTKDVAISLNAGDGGFASPVYFGGSSVFSRAAGPITSADFTGDGLPDFAALNTENNSGNTVIMYFAEGDGGFRRAPVLTVPQTSPGFLTNVMDLASGDVTGDGKPDLVVSWGQPTQYTAAQGDMEVFEGTGDGGFLAPRIVYSGTEPNMITVADFNGDGQPDVSFVSWLDLGHLRMRLSTGPTCPVFLPDGG